MQDYQIFISYKRNPDSETAEAIFKELDQKGYITFIDRIGLEGGSRFPDRIASAIHCSNLFIVLLSRATKESNWVKKEVRLAAKRAKEKVLTIVPVILDDTPQNEFSDFLPKYISNTFTFLISDGNITELSQQICNILEENNIYPPKEVVEVIKRNKETTEAIKSIPEDIATILSECKNCPRRNNKDTLYQCNLFNPSRDISDWDYFYEQSENLSREKIIHYNIPEPNREDFPSERQYQSAWAEWIHKRDSLCHVDPYSVRKVFERSVGNGHICSRKRCDSQDKFIEKLNNKIHFLNQPLFQRDLESIDTALNTLNHNLDNDDWLILERLDLQGFLPFITKHVSRAWKVKKDILNHLINIEGYEHIEELLYHHLQLASQSIRRALKTGHQIPTSDFHCFFLLWWLLRKNSCLLTYSFLDQEIRTNNNRLLQSLEEFVKVFDELTYAKTAITFEMALNIHSVDLPEEIESIGTDYLGCFLSDFHWFRSDETVIDQSDWSGNNNDLVTYSYLLRMQLDRYHNPQIHISHSKRNHISISHELFSEDNFYGLSRGAFFAGEEIFDEFYDSKNSQEIITKVSAIDYLYPLMCYCQDLINFIKKSTTSSIKLSSEHNLNFRALYKKPYHHVIPCASPNGILNDIEGITDYNIIVYSQISHILKDAISAIENGNTKHGMNILEAEAKKSDINAIVYLANLYAYREKPDYAKALPLYESAAIHGVRSCFFNVAQCYELLHDYRNAYWWYLLVQDDKSIDKEYLNMRLGNCCYHLGEYRVNYFDDAGEMGQAAKIILGLDSDGIYFTLSDLPLIKSISSIIDEVKPRLGNFELLDEKQYERDKLEESALNGNVTAQYLIGLYELEEFFTSDIFIENALNRIKNAAINNSPHALCFMGLFMQQYKKDEESALVYFEKTFKALYPSPFPNLLKME